MANINTERYCHEIEQLLCEYKIPTCAVLYVDDVQAWCQDHGIKESNPWRTAKTVYSASDNSARILIAKTITSDMIRSIIDSLEYRGFHQINRSLQDDSFFLKHLILHEICHVLNPSVTEEECDKWAFDNLQVYDNDAM